MLSENELINLLKSVFPKFSEDNKLCILVDIPKSPESDTTEWSERRKTAKHWADIIRDSKSDLNLDHSVIAVYREVGSNNAEFPEEAAIVTGPLPSTASEIPCSGTIISFHELFEQFQIFLALTQYSTTAPLKNASKKYRFRAATMPGFSEKMIPALRIDYLEVNRRTLLLKEKLDPAESALVQMSDLDGNKYRIFFDLRWRESHISSGFFPEQGMAGNLPSGETYIVPYEGERADKSKTEGILPVQFENDILKYTIKQNKAVFVNGEGAKLKIEQDKIKSEPAYANIAELGFGVLTDFGVEPINEILLDEKLGFHVAFGRSDHFGGAVGPEHFSSPQSVIHLDHIYIPATQSDITVESIILSFPDSRDEIIMESGKYKIF
jgi:hypothetical protein